jgi:hypothetical protein
LNVTQHLPHLQAASRIHLAERNPHAVLWQHPVLLPWQWIAVIFQRIQELDLQVHPTFALAALFGPLSMPYVLQGNLQNVCLRCVRVACLQLIEVKAAHAYKIISGEFFRPNTDIHRGAFLDVYKELIFEGCRSAGVSLHAGL